MRLKSRFVHQTKSGCSGVGGAVQRREFRLKYLRYKDAEIVYSIQHKKLLEMAGKAGAIYRIDGTVLINRDIFDQYLEQFHEPSTLTTAEETK